MCSVANENKYAYNYNVRPICAFEVLNNSNV